MILPTALWRGFKGRVELLLLGAGLFMVPMGYADTIDFDGPGYVPGARPPAPWTDSYEARGDTNHAALFTVASGQGVGGSQCLEVAYTGLWEGYAVYPLSRPLTPEDGAQRISVKYNPPGNTRDNFSTFGSVYVGNGWMQVDSGARVGIVFRLEDWQFSYPHSADDFQILTPGGLLGYFGPDTAPNYYELIFEIDAAWTNMTFTVIAPSGAGMTNSYPWSPASIDKVWLGECTSSRPGSGDTGNPTYDDLVVPTLTVTPVAPRITGEPQSRTAVAGATVTFTVAAQGDMPLAYQWTKDGLTLVDEGRVSGSTTATLTISNIAPQDAGVYAVTVTNAAGSASSQGATLTLYTPGELPDGVVGFWAADGSADDTIGGNHGTLENGVGFGTGHTGQAFAFDGIDDRVLLPEAAAIDISRMSQWSLGAWIKPASFTSGSWPTVYSEGRWGASLGLAYNTGQLESWINNGNAARSSDAVALNEWSHVVLVHDGVNRLFYINGTLAGTAAAVVVGPADGGSAIGDVAGNPNSSRFKGLIDDVAVFNRALSADDVRQLAGLGPNPPRIAIERSGDDVILTWTTGILQQAGAVTGPWTDLLDAISPSTNAVASDPAFFRLR
ncbi:MAG TPA: immunoglobulin domain-containing protein [Verrucomicrobiota bacterium]|nr:immunoglobulin domain-containing protein [Verrucomicrobiota bacterium]HNU52947.1 immunoglobulin domain-containing protein [Verrucomicrobiota bacterium]